MAEYTLTPTQSENIRTVAEVRGDESDPFAYGCPWCDDYTGSFPKRHARLAHEEEYQELNGDG